MPRAVRRSRRPSGRRGPRTSVDPHLGGPHCIRVRPGIDPVGAAAQPTARGDGHEPPRRHGGFTSRTGMRRRQAGAHGHGPCGWSGTGTGVRRITTRDASAGRRRLVASAARVRGHRGRDGRPDEDRQRRRDAGPCPVGVLRDLPRREVSRPEQPAVKLMPSMNPPLTNRKSITLRFGRCTDTHSPRCLSSRLDRPDVRHRAGRGDPAAHLDQLRLAVRPCGWVRRTRQPALASCQM